MPRTVKWQLSLALLSAIIAVGFLVFTTDSWLRTVGGILLLVICLVQISLWVKDSPE